MIALLAILLAAPAGDSFRAVQYTASAIRLSGCNECGNEADDVCVVRPGVQSRPLDEYGRGRWPAKGRLKLLRPSADPDCAVKNAHKSIGLAAVRLAREPPPEELVEKARPEFAVQGWPVRGLEYPAHRSKPDRAALRFALVCWPADGGWPAAVAGTQNARPLGEKNRCEFWLLGVDAKTGEPDLGAASFLVSQAPFAYGDARFAAAFDSRVPLDPEKLLGLAPVRAASAPETTAAKLSPHADQPAGCAEGALARPATLERFGQWEERIRGGAARTSLDRQAWTLDAAAWSGHCQELQILKAVVEQQLGCAIKLDGRCASAAGQP